MNTASSAASPSPAPPSPKAKSRASLPAWRNTCRPGTPCRRRMSPGYRRRASRARGLCRTLSRWGRKLDDDDGLKGTQLLSNRIAWHRRSISSSYRGLGMGMHGCACMILEPWMGIEGGTLRCIMASWICTNSGACSAQKAL